LGVEPPIRVAACPKGALAALRSDTPG
jgi:hypothetical protein